MIEYYQGDMIKITGFKNAFVIVSKNAFIKSTNVFHVCPVLKNYPSGPLHIKVVGKEDTDGIVIYEQVKLIDPSVRGCSKIDRLPYDTIMNVSDAVQGIFEYD